MTVDQATTVTATFTVNTPPLGGSITVVQDAVPDTTTRFPYNGGLGAFTLVDDGVDATARARTFGGLAAGAYVVQQGSVKGWTLTRIDCGNARVTVKLKSRSVTVNVAAGETVTCTFTDVRNRR